MTKVPADVKVPTDRPSAGRRIAAILSILLVAGIAIATVVLVLDRIGSVLAVLALMGVVALAVWYAITRAGTSRKIAVAFVIAALAAVVAVVLAESAFWSLVLRLALLVLAGALARYALSRDLRISRALRPPAPPFRQPRTVC